MEWCFFHIDWGFFLFFSNPFLIPSFPYNSVQGWPFRWVGRFAESLQTLTAQEVGAAS